MRSPPIAENKTGGLAAALKHEAGLATRAPPPYAPSDILRARR